MRSRTLFYFFVAVIVRWAAAAEWPLWDGKESIAEYAKRANLEPAKSIDLGTGSRLEFVLIPAGEFVMGAAEPAEPAATVRGSQIIASAGVILAFAMLLFLGFRWRRTRRFHFSLIELFAFSLTLSVVVWGVTRGHRAGLAWKQHAQDLLRFAEIPAYQKPAHRVVLSKPFYMGKYEITKEQYYGFMDLKKRDFTDGNNPADFIAFNDCISFCRKFNWKLKLQIALPTEAQWEFACRAGQPAEFNLGDKLNEMDANVEPNYLNRHAEWLEHQRLRGQPEPSGTLPVGSYKPNTWGLYDMHGNVEEWCNDYYDGEYYKVSPERDPAGPAARGYRVLRGGSWVDNARSSRFRSGVDPRENNDANGFRVIMPVEQTEALK